MKKPKLVTSPQCGSCQILKKRLEDNNITNFTELSAFADASFIRKHGIKQLPTLVTETKNIVGAEDIYKYLND